MIRAVIKGGSVVAKPTKGRFNFAGAVSAEDPKAKSLFEC